MTRLLLLAAVLAAVVRADAAEWFVSKGGRDTNPGRSPATAFLTIQKGVAALQPGDTLTIGPGEYHEAVKRADLGHLDHETVIHAEVPGTVFLRGDVPAPAFRPLAGHRFVHVADFPFQGEMPAVNELDTLTILKRMPNSAELEFIPGAFYHDAQAGKLYVSTSDFKPAAAHRYSVSVLPTHGVHLVRPRRVVIEGLAVSGYSAMGLVHYREETAGGIWGMFLVHGKGCVIRDCRAYLNAWGIGLHSGAPGSGDNVIERCVAWANKSSFANGDMGGITVFAARRDVIRDSTAFLNGMYGINIYGTGGAPPNYADDGGNEPQNKSRLVRNLAWGNETADLKIKTGYEYHHTAEDCVAPGLWSVANIQRGWIGRATGGKKSAPSDDLLLSDHAGLDPQREFADPEHHDYRLQATSRFRGKGPDGKDPGPFPYAANIFYVRPDGDDTADGLSAANAWKSVARAARNLRAGDTLYLEAGTYPGEAEFRAVGRADAPVAIRSRGQGRVILRGPARVRDSRELQFERLSFAGGVAVSGGAIGFDNCEFSAAGPALAASGVGGLKVTHCVFTSERQASIALSGCTQVFLSANLFGNAQGPALRLDAASTIRYSNYNSYRDPAAAWELGGRVASLAEVQRQHDQQSQALAPEFAVVDGVASLRNGALFAAAGPLGRPIGRFAYGPRRPELSLAGAPVVHSVSATTANLEWTTTLPATCQLAWGETPACERSASFNVNCFGTYSLTGLKPGQTYYFRIKSLARPVDMLPAVEAKPVVLTNAPISFTTLKADRVPATYHVATDGDDARSGLDRQNAWRTMRHAAAQANAGDTVLIAGGKYSERVRVRATGESGRPITFRALPGERVVLDGGEMVLNNAFVVGGKSHLRFDGFYLTHFNLFPNDGWSLQQGGEFQLYESRDIEISRCFSEGRGGYSAIPVAAYFVERLTIRNCVNTYKFGGMYFWRCPDLLIQNTVFAEPMIMAFVLRNTKQQKATMENCIFTDMLDKKARLNLGVLCCDGEIDGFLHRNNGYFLRDCVPLEQRALQGNQTIAQLGKYILQPLFADPLFAGDPGVAGNPKDKGGFAPDRMMEPTLRLDFDSFFATNPEFVKRGIGLQREAFSDYRFDQSRKP